MLHTSASDASMNAPGIAAVHRKAALALSPTEWAHIEGTVAEILRLKQERNAVILAHNYQVPEIFHTVADVCGDSLQLAVEASKTDADVIVQCGVHFMAETAKIMNPDKIVLIPDLKAGCSLAESITAEDVRTLKKQYPGVPVATYVNTSAEVKAESDVCITSANAKRVIEALGVPRVLCLPDEYLANNIAAETDVEIISWHGRCEVHELFTPDDVSEARIMFPGVRVLAHPECSTDVVQAADFTGSTSQMIHWVKQQQPRHALMITECSMSDNVAAETPQTEFVRPCHICPHMKRITLEGVAKALRDLSPRVELDPSTADAARAAITRMIALS